MYISNQKGLISFQFFTLVMKIFDSTVYVLPCCTYLYLCVYGLWPDIKFYYNYYWPGWGNKVTKLDKIRNERIRGTTKVGEITKKVQERRLKWYGHVMRREEHYVGRRAMVMKVQGRRKRGRPKRRWLDKVKDEIKEKGLSADDVYDRATWRRMSSYIDPT